MHAVIVGAGLAGPCLALSLAKHGIRSTLFGLRPSLSNSGGSISLGPHGLRVLDKYAGVYDRIKASGFTYRRFGAYSEEGEAFGEIYVGEKGKDQDKCYSAVRIMRSSMQKCDNLRLLWLNFKTIDQLLAKKPAQGHQVDRFIRSGD